LEAKLNVSTSIKAQNIGIDFIKAFDWLIDYNNNKIYVKRNQNSIESVFTRKVMYYAKVKAEKLEIVVKEKSQTKFNLGDEIVSVNRQKVTAENQCELQDLLNRTEDWNSLQLEVISNSK
jgi:PDZ domain-containing secreted protein